MVVESDFQKRWIRVSIKLDTIQWKVVYPDGTENNNLTLHQAAIAVQVYAVNGEKPVLKPVFPEMQ